MKNVLLIIIYLNIKIQIHIKLKCNYGCNIPPNSRLFILGLEMNRMRLDEMTRTTLRKKIRQTSCKEN